MKLQSGVLKICIIEFFFLLVFSNHIYSQNTDAYVDNGILRWKTDNSEVSLFGVNYTAPFAYSFRTLKKMNLSIKEAIDIDVAQMKRLGLDAFRVHMWDRELADSAGNLLLNEHLDLFDYLLNKLSENGIKSIITPIAWWGTGWPEPDPGTKSFSDKYNKTELITNPTAVEIQKNYIRQVMLHKNKYSGYIYKDDPSIIAVEIINEPRHPADTALVTKYINELAGVIRSLNYSKPIFYNISESWSEAQANAVTKANINGISFQWYPTSLVHNRMLEGDFLINVNNYNIPSDNVAGFNKKAKMVYEFDAADIGGSYLYPAIARSFRKAGMQFATMFAYDPTQIAWSNTEYPTHFCNLLYTPSKAISLMIAAKAFKKIPLFKDYGDYPLNNTFGEFRVSYREDLSEMNSETEFYYSNNTHSKPVKAEKLEHIAGCRNSPVIKYTGTGAYFLDRLEDGIWVLDVYPDALWIRDPFDKNSLSREVSKLFFTESAMDINIPAIKDNFYCVSLDTKMPQKVEWRQINIKPGVYLVSNNILSDSKVEDLANLYARNMTIYTPKNTQDVFIINKTKKVSIQQSPIRFSFNIASEKQIESAELFIRRSGWNNFQSVKLHKSSKYEYECDITPPLTNSGIVEYCVSVNYEGHTTTFPGVISGSPKDWDFDSKNLWILKIIETTNKLTLFDAEADYKNLLYPHFTNSVRFFTDLKYESELKFLYSLRVQTTGQQEIPFTFMSNVSRYLDTTLTGFKTLVINCRLTTNSKSSISLLLADGGCFTAPFDPDNEFKEIEIPIGSFKSSERRILPDSYPLFLNKTYKPVNNDYLDLNKLSFIQVSILNNKPESSAIITNELEISGIYLKK